jgi:hypothetical protein
MVLGRVVRISSVEARVRVIAEKAGQPRPDCDGCPWNVYVINLPGQIEICARACENDPYAANVYLPVVDGRMVLGALDKLKPNCTADVVVRQALKN